MPLIEQADAAERSSFTEDEIVRMLSSHGLLTVIDAPLVQRLVATQFQWKDLPVWPVLAAGTTELFISAILWYACQLRNTHCRSRRTQGNRVLNFTPTLNQ